MKDKVINDDRKMANGTRFDDRIICSYLYVVSKYGYPPLAEDSQFYLHEMKSIGFHSVELEGIRKQHMRMMYDLRKSIKETADKLDLKIPYFCIILPELGAVEAKQREDNLQVFEQACEVASLFGAKGVLDNAPLPPFRFPGSIPIVRHYSESILMSASFPLELNWEKYWDGLVDTYRTACDIAAKYNLNYQIHPALGVLASTTDAFLYFKDSVGRDNLRYTIDTANQYAMKDNLTLSLIRLKDHVDYIHLSDSRGSRIEHLPPGSGTIHWPSFFEVLDSINFKGDFAIDIGGKESPVENIGMAYRKSAQWLETHLTGKA